MRPSHEKLERAETAVFYADTASNACRSSGDVDEAIAIESEDPLRAFANTAAAISTKRLILLNARMLLRAFLPKRLVFPFGYHRTSPSALLSVARMVPPPSTSSPS